ncbi:MAG: short-chain dehydrogenase, partial [Pseudonocardiales bacterium]|nr:short-chain dehydrogenase [Pseudonocardiales bacterium]
MTIPEDLTGRRALVTGGSRGTGAAGVRRLREAGATVLTTARSWPADVDPDVGFIAADIALRRRSRELDPTATAVAR